MNKLLLLKIRTLSRLLTLIIFTLSMTASTGIVAQTAQIGTGNTVPANTNYGPVYRFTATSTTTAARANMLFTAAEMSAAGIPAGAQINSVEFYKANDAFFTTPATHKMYVANTSNTALATTLTWASVLSTHTEVFSTTNLTLPNVEGWVTWTFTNPYTYTGGAFEIATDLVMGGNGAATSNIPWQFTGVSGADVTKLVGSTATNATTLNGSVSAYRNRPNIRINYSSGGCTSPPVPGVATALPSTAQCAGTLIALNLSGNSSGLGQEYIWQSSTTEFGTYTDVTASLNGPGHNVTVNSSLYYRAIVICSGDTEYSAPVFVELNDPLAPNTYTINKNQPTGGSNYNSFADAIKDMECGIAGPIVFDVVAGSGPYNEQIIITSITGASSTNTITFNGNGETIQLLAAVPVTANRHVIRLDGADHIILNNLVIKSNDATYGWGVQLINNANDNTISNCTIDMSAVTSTTEANAYGILASGSNTSNTSTGTNAINLNILNNTIIGGYKGIQLNQSSTSHATGNIITGNTIRDFYATGIEFLYQDNAVIANNDIHRTNRAGVTTFTGIEFGTGNLSCLINANRIHDTHTSATTQSGAAYGIYFTGTDATSGAENKVTNNLIYNFNSGTGTVYGIYNSSSDGAHYFHNTISLDYASATSGTTRGFFQTTAASNIEFKNNIVSVTRGGSGAKHCLYFGTTTSVIASDYNALHLNTGGTSGIGFYSSNQIDLQAWQGVNGNAYDQNSVSVDPVFISPLTGDFTPTVTSVNDIGTPVGVLTDILNVSRSTSTPDPGAYEFELLGTDAEIVWISPVSPTTTGLATITVQVNNVQAQTITDLVLAYTDGNVTESQTFSGLNLLPGNNQQFNFTVQYNVLASTQMQAYITSVNGTSDAVQVNDTANYPVCVLLPAGTYTINSSLATGGSNFQDFSDVSFALSCGIAGPVVFDVVAASGPYNEQVIIPEIPGSSSVNTVILNGNGETVTYTNENTGERGIIKLNGSDYVTINDFVIEAPGTYGIGVLLNNDANFNTVSNCIINLNTTATATNYSGISISNTAASSTATGANSCDDNTFIGNTITGGYYGITVIGTATSKIQNNSVINNIIKDYYVYGIYVNGTDNTLVEGNDLSRPARTVTSTFYGVYFTAASFNAKVLRNRIHDPHAANPSHTTDANGIYFTACDAVAGSENLVANNLVYNFNTNTSINGFYNSGSSFINFYHNTFAVNDPSTTAPAAEFVRGFYQSTSANDINFRNNIISIVRGGSGSITGIYLNTPASVVQSDNNVLHLVASGSGTVSTGYHNSIHYTTLNDWQGANGGIYDFSSSVSNPTFLSPGTGNYTPTEITIDAIGFPVGVLTDINNSPRSSTNPDPGAYEFTVSPFDIGVVSMSSPNIGGCYSSSQNVTVLIKNYGSAPLNFSSSPVTITVEVTGAISATLTTTVSTGGLNPGNSMAVSVSPSINMLAAGTYIFNASTSMTSDANPLNDAMPQVSRNVGVIPGVLSASETEFCVTGVPEFTLTGSFGGLIQWQESTSGPTGPWTNVGAGNNTYTPTSPYTVNTYVQAVVSCNADIQSSNVIDITVSSPQLISTTPGERCGIGTVMLEASADPGSTLNWYLAPSGGTSVGSGNQFTTPVINSTTNFYVAASAGGATVYTGRLAPQAPAAVNLTSYGQVFTITEDITLNSVEVYSTTGTSISVSLYNSNGSQQLFTTGPNAVLTNDTTVINLGWSLAPGTYRLMNTGMSGNFIRENSTVTYPIALAGIGSITGYSTTNTATPSTSASYYWFYNWSITTGCEGPRTAVIATVSPAPSIDASATNLAICAGSSSDISVSSSNPNYTYAWTSSPAGFVNTGTGPFTVNPSVTTKYYVTATDNSAGPDAGCVAIDSVTIIPVTTLTAGTITASQTTICVSATPTFIVSGASSGLLTWQVSSSPSGPFTDLATGTPYIPSSPITQTGYYRLKVSCDVDSVFSNVLNVIVSNPQLISVNDGSRCGIGTVELSAVANANDSITWYDSPVSIIPVGTGGTFTTPVLNSTTTYYVAAGTGEGSQSIGSPVPGTSLYINTAVGWGLRFTVNSSSTINSVKMYPVSTTPGPATIQIKVTDLSDVVVATGFLYSFTATATITEHIVPVNISLPPGNYKMVLSHSGLTGLVRTSGSAPYPYTSPNNAVSITAGANGAGTAQTTGAYYWFYNWEITTGCTGERVPVTATVTPADAITLTASEVELCDGQSSQLNVTSPNSNYVYTWTPGNLIGPSQTVTPSGEVTYVVTADDGTCVNKDSVTITAYAPANAGIAEAESDSVCSGFDAKAFITGYAGPDIQWQYLDNGNWINDMNPTADDDTLEFNATASITYRAIVSVGTCDADTSNPVNFIVTTPVINSVGSNVTRCGPGDISLSASGSGVLRWYNDTTSVQAIGAGSTFSPFVTQSDTFWVEASFGLSTSQSGGFLITEFDISTPDRLELTNTGASAIDVTGWSVALSNVYGNINAVNPIVKVLSGSLAPGQRITYSDQSGASDYWGNNFQWNPGSFPGFTGWALILDATGQIRDFVALNWQAANIQGMNITVNGFPVTIGQEWAGNGIDISTVPAGTSISRKGSSDNNAATDFEIVTSTIGSVNPNLQLPFSGTSIQTCSSPRYPVYVDVTPSPAFALSASSNFSCAGEPVTLSVTTGETSYDSFTWSPPLGLSSTTGSSVQAAPTANTKYYAYALNNTTLCGAYDSITVSVQPAPVLILSAVNENGCGPFSTGLNATFSAQGNPASVLWSPSAGLSSPSVANPTATVAEGSSITYTALITNTITGCTITDSVTLSSTFAPDPVFSTGDTMLCSGNQIYLHIQDAGVYSSGYPAGTTVDWLNIVNGLSPDDSVASTNGSDYTVQVNLPDGCNATSETVTIITRSVSVVPVIEPEACGNTNGSIAVNVSSIPSVPPFRYIWKNSLNTVVRDVTKSSTDDTLSGLAGGIYTLEVLDNQNGSLICGSGILSYTVPSALPVNASIDTYNNSGPCVGLFSGSATVTVTNGTAPYTYLWSNSETTSSISGLGGGTYTVTVTDDLGCTDTAVVVINEPDSILLSFNITSPLCAGNSNGSIASVITNGIQPFIYTWYDQNFVDFDYDDVADNVAAGEYLLYVIDAAGCEAFETVVVSDPDPVSVTSFTPTNGPAGTSVSVTGVSLTGATSVSFNGTPASFTVNSSTSITAVVPAGATSGQISVVTPCGTATSSGVFTVDPSSSVLLNLHVLIEGYYTGGGLMNAVLMASGAGTDPNECDTIHVELHDQFSPSTTVASGTAVLSVNGNATIEFPSSVAGGSYYIVVLHRNAVQTWSALPVTFSSTTSYDFATSSSQSYNGNVKEMEPGTWALYSGDISSQDEFIDLFDQIALDNDLSVGLSGYLPTDLNGDGFIDLFDQIILDNNTLNGIFSDHP